MAITGSILKINGVNITGIKSYKVARNKLWKEAERTMTGDVKATLIGIFPKVEVEFTYLSQSQMASLCAKLDQPFFDLTYYDNRKDALVTASYYAGDYEAKLYNNQLGIYEPFSVTFVPVSKY